MNKFYTVLLVIISFSNISFGQVDFNNRSILQTEITYIHSIGLSPNDSMLAYGVGSYALVILDTQFHQINRFNLDGRWGGGGYSFSNDSRIIAYYSYGKLDTLSIYDFHKDKTTKLIQDDINGLFFLKKSNDLLLLYNLTSISIYSLKKQRIKRVKKFKKTVEEIKQSNNGNSIIIRFEDGSIERYDASNFKHIESIAKIDTRSYNLIINDSTLIYNVKETVYVYDYINKKTVEEIKTDFPTISDIFYDESQIIISGRLKKLIIYNRETRKMKEVALDVSEYGMFCIYQLPNKVFLLGDEYNLYLVEDSIR